MSEALPFLKSGIILANFQSRGTTPCETETLIIRVRGLAITSAESFSRRGEMLSSPLTLPVFSWLIDLRTNDSFTDLNLKHGCDLLVSSGGRLLFEVVLNPRVCFNRPTAVTKNELKLFAIFLSSPQSLPFTSMDLPAVFFSPGRRKPLILIEAQTKAISNL